MGTGLTNKKGKTIIQIKILKNQANIQNKSIIQVHSN